MKKVFVLISDFAYLEHAKSLFYNVRNEGGWKHDLCLIANNLVGHDLSDFENFGVNILYRNCENWYKINLYIFDEFFKKWDYVVYMDCDFFVFKNLENYINKFDLEYNGLIACVEQYKIHEYFCTDLHPSERAKQMSFLKEKYNIDKFGFNAGFFSFNTKIINENTLNLLHQIDYETKDINKHGDIIRGSDQPIFNLYFNNNVKYFNLSHKENIENIDDIDNSEICFWSNINNNTTVAAHFTRLSAPWFNNNYSDIFKMTYKEKYLQNLNLFYNNTKNNN